MTDTHTTAHIPDEAVQAAAEATKGIVPEDFLITALTAALPHLSMPCAVEVRPSSLVNAASILASDAPHIVVQKLDAAYSQIVTKPVDVAAVRKQAFEEAARIADYGMLVPPDGGSPTKAETDVALNIAAAIRALSSVPTTEEGK